MNIKIPFDNNYFNVALDKLSVKEAIDKSIKDIMDQEDAYIFNIMTNIFQVETDTQNNKKEFRIFF